MFRADPPSRFERRMLTEASAQGSLHRRFAEPLPPSEQNWRWLEFSPLFVCCISDEVGFKIEQESKRVKWK